MIKTKKYQHRGYIYNKKTYVGRTYISTMYGVSGGYYLSGYEEDDMGR